METPKAHKDLTQFQPSDQDTELLAMLLLLAPFIVASPQAHFRGPEWTAWISGSLRNEFPQFQDMDRVVLLGQSSPSEDRDNVCLQKKL